MTKYRAPHGLAPSTITTIAKSNRTDQYRESSVLVIPPQSLPCGHKGLRDDVERRIAIADISPNEAIKRTLATPNR